MAPSSTGRNVEPERGPTAAVRAVRTRPDRFVFMADGEPDAWIASDLLVDLVE